MAARTVDPKAKIAITAAHVPHLAYNLPVAILKNLYPVLGKEKVLRIVKETAWEETPKEFWRARFCAHIEAWDIDRDRLMTCFQPSPQIA